MTLDHVKSSLKPGFYAGIVALFISVIGMIETFSNRDIIHGVFSISHTFLVIIALITGYFSATRAQRAGIRQHGIDRRATIVNAIAGSLIAGFVMGLFLAVLVVVANLINLRPVFVNVTPALIDLLTFGRPSLAGSIVPLSMFTIVSGLGGALSLFRSDIRRLIVTSLLWFAFAGLTSEVIRLSLSRLGVNVARIFVTTRGLTPLGAAVTLALIFAIVYARQRMRDRQRRQADQSSPAKKRAVRYRSWVLIFVFLLVLPWVVGRVPSDVLVLVGIYVLMGFGLNIVVGKAGLLDLGYVAFFAVGAYSTAILTSADQLPNIQLSFWAALPFVIGITGLAGLLIGAPVLRMRGDYLAIVTLGFGEIARFLALSDWFSPVLGGAQGVVKIPNVVIGGIELADPEELYYLIMFFCLITLFISWRLEGSRVGRAWVAMREDEQVAESMGINTIYYKMLAFAMGAMIASLGGAVFAVKLNTVFPFSFSVNVSITVLSLIIIGGIGSIPGVLVGAFALVGLPELLREFDEYRLLLYGVAIIYMMIVRPEGLLPSVRRGRELHEDEMAQDAWGKPAEVIPVPANPELSG